MAYALLDDTFHSHPKLSVAGNDGAGLYARALSYCGAYLTDGFVPDGWVLQASYGKRALARKVEEAGLWHHVDGGYLIPDFNEYNPPRDRVLERRSDLSEKRAEAGRKGAAARWGRSKAYGNRDSKPDGKLPSAAMATGCPPAPEEQVLGPSTSTEAEEQSPAAATDTELDLDRSDPVNRLLLELRHADSHTENVLRSFAGHVPEAAFDIAREEIVEKRGTTKNDAGLAVSILQRIRTEGHLVTPIATQAENGAQPRPLVDVLTDFVNAFASTYPDDAILDEIGVHERKRGDTLTDQQRTQLLELAHSLRTKPAT